MCVEFFGWLLKIIVGCFEIGMLKLKIGVVYRCIYRL